MASTKSKAELLEKYGYQYNFYRMLYFNRDAKKIFSFEFIEDNDEDKLETMMKERNKEEWQFYANKPLSAQVRNDILKELKS